MKTGRLLLSVTVGVIARVDVVATVVRGRAVDPAIPPSNLPHEPIHHLSPRQDQEPEPPRRTTIITARTTITTRLSSRTPSPSSTTEDDDTTKTDDTQTTTSAVETSTTLSATETTSPAASASPSATESPLPPSEEGSGLSPGTAAGIAAGAVAAVALIALIIFLLWRKKKGGIRGAVVTADYPDTMNMVDNTKPQQYPEPTLPGDLSSRNGSATNDDPFFHKDEYAFAAAGARRQSSFSPSQVGVAVGGSPGGQGQGQYWGYQREGQQQYGAYLPPLPTQEQQKFAMVGSPGQEQQQQQQQHIAFAQTSPGQPQQQFAYAPNQGYYQQQQQQYIPSSQGGDLGAHGVPYRPVSAFTAYPSPGHPILPVSPLTPHRQSLGMASQASPYYPPHPSQPSRPPQGPENVASPNLPNFMIPGGIKSRAMSFSASQPQYEGEARQEWAAPPPPVPAMPTAVALTSPPLSPLRRNPV
ncbi:uncharacterized protein PODANS_4_3519 [Podospora anserina S mat+]|uniref:Podospora anserina S mat+ genomic DNA chromosome 4, supercontig 4 n=1 Tax=Podospora anserina (strain S / ATCC MYA-4624 / DSM 980 / FGSC 10383) TaxID=515849 RepID=B2AQP8_PODAN|nr:uncharacterized protein PODANS_4_3519 [Podospora anserina S mat+]CAP66475.1 unnamed protein product [Podospora anserina S mat+]CDP28204.1 Putative protein of unknown function [Podospora anserina S mat+]